MTDTIIDDQDLSAVHYNGSWIRGGSAHEHDQTVASSTSVGDSFTVSFFGNSISVYGTIDSTSGGVLTNYSVDNAPPEQSSSQAGTGDTFNQQFWKSPALDVGQHELVVTMVKVNADPQPGEGTIWFDYFLVRDPTIRQTVASKRLRTKKIIGGVVGGVLGLIFVLGVLFFLRRRHKDRKWGIKAQPFGRSKNGGEIEMELTNFHVGGFGSDNTNVGPISPFPFESGNPNESNGTMPIPSIPNTNPPAGGDLPRKSTLINMGRRQQQVLDQVHTTTTVTTATTPPSSTAVPPSEPPSEDHAIPISSTQEGSVAIAMPVQSGVGKHQRERTRSRVNVTIPVDSDGSASTGTGALQRYSSGLSPPQTPRQIIVLSPTESDLDPEEPLQHIDSGMRAINVQTELPSTARIELPPVYSPV